MVMNANFFLSLTNQDFVISSGKVDSSKIGKTYIYIYIYIYIYTNFRQG